MTPRERVRKLVPQSTRVQATLLGLAAVVAFLLAFALGRASADARAPLRTAPPLVARSQAVEISGLPAARRLPTLRPQPVRRKKPAAKPPARRTVAEPSPAPTRPAPAPKPRGRRAAPPPPVEIVGEG